MEDIQGRLETLRGLLHDPPSKEVFDAIWAALVDWPEADRAVGVTYAVEHLERWPDDLRRLPSEDTRRLAKGEPSPAALWPLIKTVGLHDVPGSKTRALRALSGSGVLDGLPRLDLSRTQVEEDDVGLLAGLAASGTEIVIDEALVEVIENLKATPLHGAPNVRVARFEPPRKWEGWHQIENEFHLRVTLKDTGDEGAVSMLAVHEHNRGRVMFKYEGRFELDRAQWPPSLHLSFDTKSTKQPERCLFVSCGATFNYNSMATWMDWSTCTRGDCQEHRLPAGWWPEEGFGGLRLSAPLGFDPDPTFEFEDYYLSADHWV